ncbi:MAG: UpxY family transcription antiterminator [Acidobacteriota bacterium]
METKSWRWFALYTRHQHEKSVAQGLSKMGMRAFLPLYTEVHRWRDRVKEISLPLFPNYVFVLGGLERRNEILSMAGVYDFVRLGVSPATIPDEEIEAVRQVVEGCQRVEPHPFLTTGERVRVISGPLKGTEGILIRRKSLYRLVLSVELLARSIAAEVNAYDVERVIVSIVRRGLPAIARGRADSVRQGTAPIKIDVL